VYMRLMAVVRRHGMCLDGCEGRKQISTDEYAVEVLPAIGIGIKCLDFAVFVYNGDIDHTRKRREVTERSFPKPCLRRKELWPNSQRFQGPL